MIKSEVRNTLPHHKSKLDALAVLVVTDLHAHIGVCCLVVAEAFSHLCDIAVPCPGELEVVGGGGGIL